MKISVIIPVYNAEKHIAKCIKSLKNQTYTNLEIIFINDGSSDKSLNIIRKFEMEDSRVILIDKKNEGVSISRNIGIKISTGEYITFLDSDDYIDERIYEKMYNKIKLDNSDIVMCNYYRVFIKENRNEYNKIIMNNDDNLLEYVKNEYLTESKNGFLWNKMYKATVIKDNNLILNSKIDFCEDLLFNYDVINKANKVSYVDEGLYYYVVNEDSLTSKIKDTWFYSVGKLYKKKMTMSRLWGMDNEEVIDKITSSLLVWPYVLCRFYSLENKPIKNRISKINDIISESYDFINKNEINYKKTKLKINQRIFYCLGNNKFVIVIYFKILNLFR